MLCIHQLSPFPCHHCLAAAIPRRDDHGHSQRKRGHYPTASTSSLVASIRCANRNSLSFAAALLLEVLWDECFPLEMDFRVTFQDRVILALRKYPSAQIAH